VLAIPNCGGDTGSQSPVSECVGDAERHRAPDPCLWYPGSL